MAASPPLKTRVSTKGQVILPKPIREQRNWPVGTELVVENTEAGVLLRAAPAFEPSSIGQVFGMLRRPGRALTIEEMDAALEEEARRRAGD
ncbi:MAG TPA: AbrB/MazE/SpoVT family DNA-binding domain-containing protein [Caulobacteraceae bacterium]